MGFPRMPKRVVPVTTPKFPQLLSDKEGNCIVELLPEKKVDADPAMYDLERLLAAGVPMQEVRTSILGFNVQPNIQPQTEPQTEPQGE